MSHLVLEKKMQPPKYEPAVLYEQRHWQKWDQIQ